MNLKPLIVILVFYAFLAIFALRKILIQEGTVGHSWDWFVPPSQQYLTYMANTSFFVWDEYALGFYGNNKIMSKLFYFLFTSFGYIGATGEFVSKFLLFLPIVLGGTTMYYLVEDIIKKEFKGGQKNKLQVAIPAILSGCFFTLSPLQFNDMIGGGTSLFISFSFVPLAFFLYRKATRNRNKKTYILLLALTLTIISFSIQYLVFTSLVLLLYSFIQPKRFESIKKLLISYVLFILLNSFWIVPLIFSGIIQGLFPTTPAENPQTIANLIHAVPSLEMVFLGLGYVFHDFFFYTINPLVKPFWFINAFSLVILIFVVSYILSKPKKEVVFWSLTFLLSLIISTVGLPPFGDAVLWVYKNIPLSVIFRSPMHNLMLRTLSLTLLFGMSIFLLLSKVKSNKKQILILSVFSVMIIIYISPFFTGDLGWDYIKNTLPEYGVATFKLSPGYENILNSVSNEKNDFRLLFIPMTHSPFYLETEYQKNQQGRDPLVHFSPKPVIIAHAGGGVLSPYTKDFTELVRKLLYEKNSPNITKNLLDLLTVKYIILRKDIIPCFGPYIRRQLYSQIYNNLKHINGIELIKEYEYVSLWENQRFLPRIYATNELFYISKEELDSHWSILNTLKFSEKGGFFSDERFKNKSTILLIKKDEFPPSFWEELVTDFEKESDINNWSITEDFTEIRLSSDYSKKGNYSLRVFYNSSMNHGGGYINFRFPQERDLSDFEQLSLWIYYPDTPSEKKFRLLFYNESSYIPHSHIYSTHPLTKKGWNFLIFDLHEINLNKIKKIRFEFFDPILNFKEIHLYLDDVRLKKKGSILLPNVPTEILIYLNKSSIYKIGVMTYSEEKGTLTTKINNHTLNIIIPKSDNQEAKLSWSQQLELKKGNYSIQLSSNKNIIISSMVIKPVINHSYQSISFQKINPSLYRVHVNTTHPFFLIFSESYNTEWKAYDLKKKNDLSWIEPFYLRPDFNHFLVNGYANGWYVTKTGEYTLILYFRPQSLFYLSSAISLITLILSISYLVYFKFKQN